MIVCRHTLIAEVECFASTCVGSAVAEQPRVMVVFRSEEGTFLSTTNHTWLKTGIHNVWVTAAEMTQTMSETLVTRSEVNRRKTEFKTYSTDVSQLVNIKAQTAW